MRRLLLYSLLLIATIGLAAGVSAQDEILYQKAQIIINNVGDYSYSIRWLGDAVFPANFSAQTNATRRGQVETAYGFVWGSSELNFYEFIVTTRLKQFSVWEMRNGVWLPQSLGNTGSSSVKTGVGTGNLNTYNNNIKTGVETNKLALVVDGNKTYLYANDVLLQTVELKNQGAVRIGVVVDSYDHEDEQFLVGNGATFQDTIVRR